MLCAEWCLVKRTNPGLSVIPLRCRCWSCEECQPLRKARLVHEAKAGQPTLFVTITSRYQEDRSPNTAARALVRAWRQFRAEYIARHGKGSMPFLAVFEKTKRGWPHLHIVARGKWISQTWLSARMAELIGSPIVWVERVKSGKQIAAYVSKYIGKDPQPFAGTKRYWRSRDYLLPDPDADLDDAGEPEPWRVVQMHWLTYVLKTEPLGFVASYARSGAALYYRKPP